jgi:hypothetical protein
LASARSYQLIDSAIFPQAASAAGLAAEPAPQPGRDPCSQAILQETGPLAGFRSRLALNGALVASEPGERWDGERLLAWLDGGTGAGRGGSGPESPGVSGPPETGIEVGSSPAQTRPYRLRLALLALAVLGTVNLVLFLLSAFGPLPPFWIVTFVLYVAIYTSQVRELGEVFSNAQRLGATLEKFRAVLVYLETYPYRQGSRLARLCEPFWRAGQRPSRILRRIAWIASAASLQGNPLVWVLLNAALPWDILRLLPRPDPPGSARLLPAWLDACMSWKPSTPGQFRLPEPGIRFPRGHGRGPACPRRPPARAPAAARGGQSMQ